MRHIQFAKTVKDQSGSAMIVALMVMAILSITGIYTINTAVTEQKIASNTETRKMAFNNADSGVQYTLRKIYDDLNDPTNPKDIDEILVSGQLPYATPAGFNFTVTPTNTPWTENGAKGFICTGTGPKDAEFSIEVMFNNETRLAPPFQVGILSDGDIRINGAPNIIGSIHANGNVTQNGLGTINGSVSAHGTTSVGAVVSGDVLPGSDEMDVPKVTADDFNELKLKAQTPPNIYISAADLPVVRGALQPYQFNLPDNTDYGNIIVYVEGDIDINANFFHNATLVAEGDIQVRGSSEVNLDGSIGTAMIAGGDIQFNGSNDSYGAFWSNGSAVWNGSGFMHGSIVSGGNITRNGVLNFVYDDFIDNDNIPSELKVILESWEDTGLTS